MSTWFKSPSGRLHTQKTCSGAGGAHTMKKVKSPTPAQAQALLDSRSPEHHLPVCVACSSQHHRKRRAAMINVLKGAAVGIGVGLILLSLGVGHWSIITGITSANITYMLQKRR